MDRLEQLTHESNVRPHSSLSCQNKIDCQTAACWESSFKFRAKQIIASRLKSRVKPLSNIKQYKLTIRVPVW